MRIFLGPWVILLVLCGGESAHAESSRSRSSGSAASSALFLDVGESFVNMNKVTTDPEKGSANLWGTSQHLFSFGARLGSFRPEIGYTFISRKPADKSYASTLLVLQLPILFQWGGTFIKAGPTYWMQKISGKGGDITMPNGTSTATFSLPGRSTSTTNLGVLVGALIPITRSVALDTDLTFIAPFSNRRSMNLIAQLSWSFYDL